MDALGILLLGGAVGLGLHGVRRMRRGLREADSLSLVRGIRGLVTAIAVIVFALALVTGECGLLVFAVVFLAEELYETGVLLLIIRASGDAEPGRATP